MQAQGFCISAPTFDSRAEELLAAFARPLALYCMQDPSPIHGDSNGKGENRQHSGRAAGAVDLYTGLQCDILRLNLGLGRPLPRAEKWMEKPVPYDPGDGVYECAGIWNRSPAGWSGEVLASEECDQGERLPGSQRRALESQQSRG